VEAPPDTAEIWRTALALLDQGRLDEAVALLLASRPWEPRSAEDQLEEAMSELRCPPDLPSIEMAAKRWDGAAARVMAILHQAGLSGVVRSHAVALAWWRRAAEAGNVPGMAGYGWILVFGRDWRRSPDEGVRWLERAATSPRPHRTGSLDAASALVRLYRFGEGRIRPDAQKVARWEARRAALAAVRPPEPEP
jgi:TPR repeat protein